MEKRFLDKVENNAVVRIWSKKTKQKKGDSLAEGYMSELWDFTRINLFYCNYGDLPYLLDVKMDKHLFRALAQYWNPVYSCFTFGKSRQHPNFLKEANEHHGMSEQWVAARIKQKGDSKCIHWKSLRDLILTHLDTKKRVYVFALSIYGLVIFSKALGHIDEAVSDLFDRLDKRVMPILAILAKTFRSLSACRRAGEGRFIGCAQLLLAWFHSHFWKVPLLRIWGAIAYAHLLVLRSYRSRQFIPATVNDNIPVSSQENTWPMEEHLQVIPSELEIIKQDFKKRSLKLGKKIEQLEEEKMQLGLDIDV
ncbi:hypothetical protein Godav_029440 [Gossypium davidsonii]|uniref:DUF7745 domain-containing protein n=1 Tax=Gossypium davidsonii TaxID=34287 RepID=A0A7J8TKM2_GOSDV|nr:hypothetical protein [Gossypium davidsonii]